MMTSPWAIRALLPAAVAIALSTASCDRSPATRAPDGAVHPDTTVVDSAGVRIVINHGPAWPEDGGWRVDPEPEVEIGPRDEDPRYDLYQVDYTVLLEDGGVAVPNRGSHEIFFYDRRGRFEAIVAGTGEGPGELRWINHLGPHPDGVFITDGASTVLVYDRRHRLVQDLRLGDFAAEGLRFWPVGAFPDGSLVGSLGGPRPDYSSRRLGESWLSYEDAVRVDAEGRIVARLPRGGQREQVLEERPGGRASPGAVTFGANGGIVLVRGDHAYRGVMSEYSIELYDSTFALRTIFRLDEEPRAVTSQDIEEYIRWTAEAWGAASTEQVSPDLLRFLREHRYGSTYPAWGAPWILDDTGHLWVPEFAREPPERWRVYDEAGVFLGKVRMPDGFEAHDIRSGRVVGRWRDDLDVEHARVHRIEY